MQRDSLLPSKARPTISPSALSTGLPEFPPVMSLLLRKLTGRLLSGLFSRMVLYSGLRLYSYCVGLNFSNIPAMVLV